MSNKKIRCPDINTFVSDKKIRAPQKNNTVVFVAFSKTLTSRKTPFFRVGRNFEDRKPKNKQKITDRRSHNPKIILRKLSFIKHGVARNFGGGVLITILCLFFDKPVLWKHFIENSRENIAPSYARGNIRACIFFWNWW